MNSVRVQNVWLWMFMRLYLYDRHFAAYTFPPLTSQGAQETRYPKRTKKKRPLPLCRYSCVVSPVDPGRIERKKNAVYVCVVGVLVPCNTRDIPPPLGGRSFTENMGGAHRSKMAALGVRRGRFFHRRIARRLLCEFFPCCRENAAAWEFVLGGGALTWGVFR